MRDNPACKDAMWNCLGKETLSCLGKAHIKYLCLLPIDDLVNLPYIDVLLDLKSFWRRLLRFIRVKCFGPERPIRVPVLLRTQYLYSLAILFLEGTTTSIYTDHRNIVISPRNDPSRTIYPNNRIVTKKYTPWNFIPKNLFEQFRRIANFYFLLTALISAVTVSPISPVTSILPLSFVILVTACKQGYEDYLRHVQDRRVNRAFVTVIRNKCMQNIHCEHIVVGDLVKVCRDQDVPCDLLLLFSTEDCECCYVTTSNLDGETNLKTLMVPKALSKMSATQIANIEATIICQHPTSDLYGFYGHLEVHNSNQEYSSTHLNIDNMLLRGSKLKDSEYIIGCAVYTGQDTKLSLNSKIRGSKLSTAEKSINLYIIVFIVLLLAEVLESCMLKVIMDYRATWASYLGPSNPVTFSSLLHDCLNFMVLYNYIVPISLYVTIELQKFLSSFFFSWDIDIYDEDSDQPALANTSDLNEELGQVEFLFTDKTGTLTENLMVFRRCSINGTTYMEKDCDGFLYLLPPNGNEEEAIKLTTWQPEIWHFMISIALCHSVQIVPNSQMQRIIARREEFRESFRQKKITRVNSSLMMHPDLPEYQATSADEKSLVEASARCGVIFQRHTSDTMELKVDNGVLTFEKLVVLEFTSERKRMSVIVKDAAGDYWLYCKGADSAILPLIVSGKINETIAHVADFSMRGFRTLVVAYKKMEHEEYNRLLQKVERARQIIGIERGAYMERAYNLMESGLTLLGVTAVEDRLQDGVEDTLESLRVAGVKIWILTGDKAETAENIALLCGHFKQGTEILRMVQITDDRSCSHHLSSLENLIKLEPYKQYGFLIDGGSITIALKSCSEKFRWVGMACESVVCCRLTPLQKSEIITLIKRDKSKPHTAAIGDGGNDVSMIQEAHVGIGIMGKEGRQATMCSDFAIAKFKFLKKVLLVHGRWYYVRVSKLVLYFFYKNFMFITPQLLFSINSGFSTQAFYDGALLMLFNVLFTSMPILVFGLLEQDYSADKLLRYPYLYKMYKHNYLMTAKQLLQWSLLGLWHTLTSYYTTVCFVYINPVTLSNNTPIDQWTFSTLVYYLVTTVANLTILVNSSYWTWPLVITVIASELLLIAFGFIYSIVQIRYDGDMLGVFYRLASSLTFWLLTIMVVAICLIPDYLLITYNSYRPARIARRNEERPQSISNQDDNMESLPMQTRSQSVSWIIPWRDSFTPGKAT